MRIDLTPRWWTRLWPVWRVATLLAVGALLCVARPSLDGGVSHYVHIRWRADVSDVERWWLERRFSLRTEHQDGRSYGYDLLDSSPANVGALLDHPAVEDTASFDRSRKSVSPDAETGRSRTGLAWRWRLEGVLPWLRPLGLIAMFVAGVLLVDALLARQPPQQRAVPLHGPPVGSARFRELDVLRGLAATAVVLFHFTSRFATHYGHPGRPLVVVPWGYYGVHLFFVVSGMVIFLTIERMRSPWDFVAARIGRLFPAYWVAVTLTFLAVTATHLPEAALSVRDYVWNLSMLQRFVDVPDVDGVYWTLQVELAFYVVMLVILACRAVPMTEAILVGWLAVLTWNAAGGGLLREGLETSRVQFVSLYGYAPLFLAGVLLHLQRMRGLTALRAVLLGWAFGVFAWRNSAEAAMVFGVIVVAVELAIHGYLARLAVRPLLLLGAVSYPLYLIHQNIGYVLLRSLYARGVPTDAGLIVTLTAVLLLAWLLHVVVEAPGQRVVRSLRARLGRTGAGAEA